MSPWSNRSPLGSSSPGLSRVSSFLNGYPQGGYASSPGGNYGSRVDGRVSPGSIPPSLSNQIHDMAYYSY
ncbi:hypothetical protein MLD38_036758 [Melastoma candidum]|uniref:Uncharacterized protein n=1 Tax=Melastoma candidum TaxID=119954 RepID=A0ACB9LL83_9MYRT|nr:hypothetical protein MLD38_036758 [Melastoma candidum]